ncbi:unnamed protein product [Candidula unifasciata]|uniref:Uncharacterized protein n=1 Tax=Candidula unifasciata TaxID=100452 RepID=A0A8S3ZHX5_9EUPU|nr:unnamed protein product [Candidula unifasciata]
MVALNNTVSLRVEGLLGTSHTDDLAWLIPAVVAGIIFFIIFALLCFYGIRKCELKIMSCCFNTCGCCGLPGRGEDADETIPLTGRLAGNSTQMKEYRTNRTSSRDPYDFLL